MVCGEPLAHTPHKFKIKEMKAGGDYMPKVAHELQSLVQKTGRPTSLYYMMLLRTDYYSPLNSLATVWHPIFLILFP